MAGRVEQIIVDHKGRCAVWFEGSDYSSDYFNMVSNASQQSAMKWIAERGITKGCHVEATNPRNPDEEPESHRKAARFARRAGIQYNDKVWYPHRATFAEAWEDMERWGLYGVRGCGTGWRDDDTYGECWVATDGKEA